MSTRPKISLTQAVFLEGGFTKEEIRNGYTSLFFKKALVGDEFCQAVMEFFNTGRLLKWANHSIISLIPKLIKSLVIPRIPPLGQLWRSKVLAYLSVLNLQR